MFGDAYNAMPAMTKPRRPAPETAVRKLDAPESPVADEAAPEPVWLPDSEPDSLASEPPRTMSVFTRQHVQDAVTNAGLFSSGSRISTGGSVGAGSTSSIRRSVQEEGAEAGSLA